MTLATGVNSLLTSPLGGNTVDHSCSRVCAAVELQKALPALQPFRLCLNGGEVEPHSPTIPVCFGVRLGEAFGSLSWSSDSLASPSSSSRPSKPEFSL